MTALTIVIANPASWGEARDGESIGGVTITSDAFETVLPWFPYILTVAVMLFAISTVLTWGYYGLKSWTYLFGRSRTSETVYKSLYTLFAVAGSLLTLETLITWPTRCSSPSPSSTSSACTSSPPWSSASSTASLSTCGSGRPAERTGTTGTTGTRTTSRRR
ncbi:hypothetical protein SMICM304S_05785 [Streptomyces microflavus]